MSLPNLFNIHDEIFSPYYNYRVQKNWKCKMHKCQLVESINQKSKFKFVLSNQTHVHWNTIANIQVSKMQRWSTEPK